MILSAVKLGSPMITSFFELFQSLPLSDEPLWVPSFNIIVSPLAAISIAPLRCDIGVLDDPTS